MLSALAGLAGCAGDDAEQTRTTEFKRSELTRPADSGRFEARACEVLSPPLVARSVRVRPARLEAKPNNSLDLSICEWHGGRVRTVKLLVDSAPRAQLRYGVAGAWWTRATRQLVAYDEDKMIKLRVNVRGLGDREARAAAVRLAKRAVRELRRRA